MVDQTFQADQLVWAKMQSYPHWPAKIIEPDEELINMLGPLNQKKGEHYVCFFGPGNYAAIPVKNIIPHSKKMFDSHDKKKRMSKDLRAAIDEMKEYCRTSVANSKEPVPIENISCELMPSKVKAVTEHSNENSDEPSCEPTTSEVNDVAAELEIEDLGCEPLPVKVAVKRAIDFGVESSCEPKRFHVTSADSSEIFPEEHVYPSTRLIGILGLGEIGITIVRKLLDTGHDVTVFDINVDRLSCLKLEGVKVAESPNDICDKCELVFCCAVDACVHKVFMFDMLGISVGFLKSGKRNLKGYIEMTPMDESQLIETAESVITAGVPFLEVPVSGSAYFLAKRELGLFAAGDKNLFNECHSIFCAISKVEATYVGNVVGGAVIANQMLNAGIGFTCVAFQEALAFATTVKKIPLSNLRRLLKFCKMDSSLFTRQMNAVEEKTFVGTFSLYSLQQDMQRVLKMGNLVCHLMPIVAQSNNSLLQAHKYNFSTQDISNVYVSSLL